MNQGAYNLQVTETSETPTQKTIEPKTFTHYFTELPRTVFIEEEYVCAWFACVTNVLISIFPAVLAEANTSTIASYTRNNPECFRISNLENDEIL